jgi:hypothetical protein
VTQAQAKEIKLLVSREEEEGEELFGKRGMGGPPVSSRRVGILPTSSFGKNHHLQTTLPAEEDGR